MSGTNPDGSVAIIDRNGATRSIRPHYIEKRTTGPRGGTKWEPVITIETD